MLVQFHCKLTILSLGIQQASGGFNQVGPNDSIFNLGRQALSTLHGGSSLDPTEQSFIDEDGHVAKKMKNNKNKKQYRNLDIKKVESEEEEEVDLVGGGVVMKENSVEATGDAEIVLPEHFKQHNSGRVQSQQQFPPYPYSDEAFFPRNLAMVEISFPSAPLSVASSNETIQATDQTLEQDLASMSGVYNNTYNFHQGPIRKDSAAVPKTGEDYIFKAYSRSQKTQVKRSIISHCDRLTSNISSEISQYGSQSQQQRGTSFSHRRATKED